MKLHSITEETIKTKSYDGKPVTIFVDPSSYIIFKFMTDKNVDQYSGLGGILYDDNIYGTVGF